MPPDPEDKPALPEHSDEETGIGWGEDPEPDDEEPARTGVAELVSSWGYRTEMAKDGLEALDKVVTWSPAIVVTDLAMPRMDGISLMAAMRKHPEYKNIPVILLTAAQDRDTILRARNLGVRDYLLKSNFSLDELMNRAWDGVIPGICFGIWSLVALNP